MLKSQTISFLSPLLLLLKRYALALLIFFFLRLFFVIYNINQLPSTDFVGIIGVFWGSFLYDWIFSWYSLVPVFFITWLQIHFPNQQILAGLGRFWFALVVLIVSTLTFIDAFYFPFAKVRTGAELLTLTGDNNTSMMVYISDYWWAVLLILAITFLGFYFYPRTKPAYQSKYSFVFLLFIPFGLLLSRGGFRLKPLHTTDAILFAPDGPWQATLNSGLVFAQTYLDNSEALFPEKINNAHANLADLQQFKKSANYKNVVIVILESFGKEYTGFNGLGRPSYTPYLDSLAQHALVFNHFYASGLKSMDAVPALFSSIPALLNKPFITTPFSMKAMDALPNLLQKTGYSSAFFHGADVNSMGFRSYLKKMGMQRYYSKDDFGKSDEYYDGNWGIFDEPYMQYAAEELNAMPKPFVCGIFTLSSHHPYALPTHLENKFKSGTLPIHKSIQYADYALQQFMQKMATYPWYQNTLFIITADHSSQNETAFYREGVGKYAIPLLFFTPDGTLKGKNNKVGSQIDIMPSVLDYLGFPNSFISMGRSLFRTDSKGMAIQYFQGTYSAAQEDYAIEVAKQKVIKLTSLQPVEKGAPNLLSTKRNTADSIKQNMSQFQSNFQYRLEQNALQYKF
jgi:phosphoglycerol transferase MdoB-like AlkP superfamily enzyme